MPLTASNQNNNRMSLTIFIRNATSATGADWYRFILCYLFIFRFSRSNPGQKRKQMRFDRTSMS